MNKLIAYFDLTAKARTKGVEAFAGPPKSMHWLPQYFALVVGIFVEKYWSHYRTTGTWDLTGALGYLVFSLITALLIFPGAYKNSMDPNQPLPVQFCVIFVSGMGWQSLVANALPGSAG